jgi:hypothetical protein
MPQHNFPTNGEFLYTAEAEDQGKALDECVEWASKRFVLSSIIWKELWKEMGKEKHVFTIHYTSKIDAAQSGNPKL